MTDQTKNTGVLTDRQMLETILQELDIGTTFCERCGHGEDCKDMDVAYMLRDHLAAPQSPVAPECSTDVCKAAKRDGVLCADDECDIAAGARAPIAPADEQLRYNYGPDGKGPVTLLNGDIIRDAVRNLRSAARTVSATVPITGHKLHTSEGGRGYVAEYFAKRMNRHDFGRYITERLAADFACALAAHLDSLPSAPTPPTSAADADLLASLARVADDFEDSNETDVPDSELAAMVKRGWLECVHYVITPQGNAAIAASKETT